MTKSKKTSAKKTLPKTSTKSPAKKAATKKSEDKKLHQSFINSLKNLENFWDKQVINLKKQLDALQVKQEKTAKQKTTKASTNNNKSKKTDRKKTIASQDELSLLREKLAEAKSSANKYAALSKMIVQFERDWGKNSSDTKKVSPSKNKKNTEKDILTATKTELKPHLKDKNANVPTPLLMDNEDIELLDETGLEEDIEEDLEDIFMPQDDLSEFEVIEDFNTDLDEDNYDDYS